MLTLEHAVKAATQTVSCLICGAACGKVGATIENPKLRAGAFIDEKHGQALCGRPCGDEFSLRLNPCEC